VDDLPKKGKCPGEEGAVARRRQEPLIVTSKKCKLAMKRVSDMKNRIRHEKSGIHRYAALHTRMPTPNDGGSAWNYQGYVFLGGCTRSLHVLPSVGTWKSFTIERCSSDRALARPRKHRIDIAKDDPTAGLRVSQKLSLRKNGSDG